MMKSLFTPDGCTSSTDSVLNLLPLYSVVSKNFVSVSDTKLQTRYFDGVC